MNIPVSVSSSVYIEDREITWYLQFQSNPRVHHNARLVRAWNSLLQNLVPIVFAMLGYIMNPLVLLLPRAPHECLPHTLGLCLPHGGSPPPAETFLTPHLRDPPTLFRLRCHPWEHPPHPVCAPPSRRHTLTPHGFPYPQAKLPVCLDCVQPIQAWVLTFSEYRRLSYKCLIPLEIRFYLVISSN